MASHPSVLASLGAAPMGTVRVCTQNQHRLSIVPSYDTSLWRGMGASQITIDAINAAMNVLPLAGKASQSDMAQKWPRNMPYRPT